MIDRSLINTCMTTVKTPLYRAIIMMSGLLLQSCIYNYSNYLAIDGMPVSEIVPKFNSTYKLCIKEFAPEKCWNDGLHAGVWKITLPGSKCDLNKFNEVISWAKLLKPESAISIASTILNGNHIVGHVLGCENAPELLDLISKQEGYNDQLLLDSLKTAHKNKWIGPSELLSLWVWLKSEQAGMERRTIGPEVQNLLLMESESCSWYSSDLLKKAKNLLPPEVVLRVFKVYSGKCSDMDKEERITEAMAGVEVPSTELESYILKMRPGCDWPAVELLLQTFSKKPLSLGTSLELYERFFGCEGLIHPKTQKSILPREEFLKFISQANISPEKHAELLLSIAKDNCDWIVTAVWEKQLQKGNASLISMAYRVLAKCPKKMYVAFSKHNHPSDEYVKARVGYLKELDRISLTDLELQKMWGAVAEKCDWNVAAVLKKQSESRAASISSKAFMIMSQCPEEFYSSELKYQYPQEYRYSRSEYIRDLAKMGMSQSDIAELMNKAAGACDWNMADGLKNKMLDNLSASAARKINLSYTMCAGDKTRMLGMLALLAPLSPEECRQVGKFLAVNAPCALVDIPSQLLACSKDYMESALLHVIKFGSLAVAGSEYSSTTCMTKMLEKGARPNITHEDGDTPLLVAVNIGNKDAVDALIRAGAKVDVSDKNGDTPLKIAVKKGIISIIKILISARANPNLKNNNGESALDFVYKSNDVTMVVALTPDLEGLKRKCIGNIFTFYFDTNGTDSKEIKRTDGFPCAELYSRSQNQTLACINFENGFVVNNLSEMSKKSEICSINRFGGCDHCENVRIRGSCNSYPAGGGRWSTFCDPDVSSRQCTRVKCDCEKNLKTFIRLRCSKKLF